MMFLGVKLSDWGNYGNSEIRWNYWRRGEEGSLIGLIVNDVNDFEQDPNSCFWQFDMVARGSIERKELCYIYTSICGERHYRYHELEVAKQEVDQFLERVNKLRGFI